MLNYLYYLFRLDSYLIILNPLSNIQNLQFSILNEYILSHSIQICLVTFQINCV